MNFDFRHEPLLTLHGFSPEPPRQIFERVVAGARPSSLKGDFVLVAQGVDAATGLPLTIFISTVIAAVPYFFAKTEAHCVHAPNVFDCCKAAGLKWHWNWNGVAQLVMFDHVLGDASLHPDIHRVPAASVMRICGSTVEVDTEPFWATLHADSSNSPPPDIAGTLLEILSELPESGGCSLSLSAGYDSRVLLACLTHLKRRPATASMGGAQATDPRIAAELARATGCEFRRVEIEPSDYVTSADDILKSTSGEKIFWHWHTAIYSRKAGFDPGAIHLAGSNGEFARSYFFDKGFVAELLDFAGYTRWDRWLSLKNASARRVPPEIRAALPRDNGFTQALDARRQVAQSFVGHLPFGVGLDYFYAAERVRNFIGLGLALYRSSFPTMSPFLDARFIRGAARLARHDKLADRMHRGVIGQLNPKLLDIPTDESGTPMRQAPEPFYFLKRKPSNAYQRHAEAHGLPQVAHWAKAGFEVLDSNARLDANPGLAASVGRWNHAITLGATSGLIGRLGIAAA